MSACAILQRQGSVRATDSLVGAYGEHDAAGQEQDVPKVLDRYAIFRAIAHVALLPVLRATIPPSPTPIRSSWDGSGKNGIHIVVGDRGN